MTIFKRKFLTKIDIKNTCVAFITFSKQNNLSIFPLKEVLCRESVNNFMSNILIQTIKYFLNWTETPINTLNAWFNGLNDWLHQSFNTKKIMKLYLFSGIY